MAYTAQNLIVNAYYLSGIVVQELETVSGSRLETGLRLLNNRLSFKNVQQKLIPFYKEYQFNTVANQESYYVPGLVDWDSVTFNIGDLRLPTYSTTRREYFQVARADNVTALPFVRHVERELNGARLYFYFIPQGVFSIKIFGRFALTQVDYNDDMLLVYERNYIEYLEYDTAQSLCNTFQVNLPEQIVDGLKERQQALTQESPPDISLKITSFLNANRTISAAQMLLGQGLVPGGGVFP